MPKRKLKTKSASETIEKSPITLWLEVREPYQSFYAYLRNYLVSYFRLAKAKLDPMVLTADLEYKQRLSFFKSKAEIYLSEDQVWYFEEYQNIKTVLAYLLAGELYQLRLSSTDPASASLTESMLSLFAADALNEYVDANLQNLSRMAELMPLLTKRMQSLFPDYAMVAELSWPSGKNFRPRFEFKHLPSVHPNWAIYLLNIFNYEQHSLSHMVKRILRQLVSGDKASRTSQLNQLNLAMVFGDVAQLLAMAPLIEDYSSMKFTPAEAAIMVDCDPRVLATTVGLKVVADSLTGAKLDIGALRKPKPKSVSFAPTVTVAILADTGIFSEKESCPLKDPDAVAKTEVEMESKAEAPRARARAIALTG